MITIHYTDYFCTVTFARPQKKNALNQEMYLKLIEALKYSSESKSIKALIIRSQGDYFCSGHDINEFVKTPDKFDASHPILSFLKYLESFPKLLICVLDGHAVGIGVTMLLHADLVVAQKKVKFSIPFIEMGLCAEAGSSQLLQRFIGKPMAREMLLLGKYFLAEQLKDKIVNELTTSTIHSDAVLTLMKKKINELPLAALLKNKDLMRYRSEDIHQTMEREAQAFSYLLNSVETQRIIEKKLELLKEDPKKKLR